MPFLPTDLKEAAARGWNELDIVIVSGDAYVDHPSFGAAIIGRHLEAAGFRVGIIPQPDPGQDSDFMALGKPRLFFGITAGNMDSLVCNYTAQRKKRNDDAYSPGGKAGLRPDRATLIYANILKRLYKKVPLVLGGIEASMRRLAHYDFWQDKVRASILADAKASILVYGMGEKAVVEIARSLQSGNDIAELASLPGTVTFSPQPPSEGDLVLPDNLACVDKLAFHRMTHLFEENQQGRTLYQMNGGRWLRHNPPVAGLEQEELDRLYALPFEYAPHPRYGRQTIPAFEQIRDSLTSHRGCYGGCNFCAIASHQGRAISSRSADSLVREAKTLSAKRGKAISISDVGGPTANMYASLCELGWPDSCKRPSCLYPKICSQLKPAHREQLRLLQRLEQLPEVKNVFIASGIRHDLALRSPGYISALAAKYTGGRLKLAPEHSVPAVLRLMGKPDVSSFEEFSREFFRACNQAGLKRQIIPYIIIGHPGTTIEDALELRRWLVQNRLRVEQVQEFTPTPMTISTCMYYTHLDYYTGKPLHVPKPAEVRRQKELALWHLN
ncbi:MAG: YgiQ family radical SAM protein [Candidatus Cloacimonetes bacterium]|nr:YgiQ family radical SAM protein [Candidatus Cloacimonadota bacterium]